MRERQSHVRAVRVRESVHVSVSMHVSERGSERSQCLHVSSSTPPSLQTHTYTLACMHYAYMCINQVFGATDGFGKGNVFTHTHTHTHSCVCMCMYAKTRFSVQRMVSAQGEPVVRAAALNASRNCKILLNMQVPKP